MSEGIRQLYWERQVFETVLNTVDALIMVLDLEGKILRYSAFCERLTGFDFSQMKDKPFWEYFIQGSEVERVKQDFRRLLQGKAHVENLCHWRTTSGELRLIKCSSSPVFNSEGQVVYIVSIGVDITEQTRVGDRLRQSEERYRNLFETIPIGVMLFDEEGRIFSCNPAARKMLGLSPEQIEGHRFERPVYKLLREDGREYRADEHPAYLAFKTGKEINNVVIGIYHPQREERRWFNVHATPWFRQGETRPYQIYVTLEDITEQKLTQEEIARLDRLNLIGQMGAGIGHEVRNPMTTVKGFLQFLSEKPEYAKDKEYFELMIDEIDRANSIITEFLSIARSKFSEMTVANLNDIINRIYPLLEVLARNMNKTITLHLNPIPDLLVNPQEIQQLIYNLVRNGLEAVKEGGEVQIRTYVRQRHVVMEIRDNGEGIDPNLVDRLGTPFLTTKPQGTGLGLAICYGIAARHAAKIDVRTSSQGTSFYVKFDKNRK